MTRPRLVDRLRSARLALGGVDESGNRVHPSMFDPEVISLAHGDGTRRPPGAVVAAGMAALLETERASLDDYTFLQRHHEFDAAITADFTRNGIPPDIAANVCIDSGTTRMFAAFMHAAVSPGDTIGVPRSYYHAMPAWCELARVEPQLIRTTAANGYKLTAEALDRWHRRARRPRALFLFNPTQTGALYTREELAGIAEVVRRTGLLVLEDSVFAGTEFPGRRRVCHLAAAAPDAADRVVTLKGASKAYNLANIRLGWGCGPPGLIQAMNDYAMTTTVTVPFLAKAMGLAALRAPTGYLRANAVECGERAALVTALVDECNQDLGAELLAVAHRPEAGHAILLAAPGLAGRRLADGSVLRGSIDLARFLLSAAGVAVSPGYSLGFDGTELRVVFGSVGNKHTYPPAAAGELGLALERLAALCGRSRPEATRQIRAASRSLLASSAEPGPGLFQPGRELIVSAFRDRIAPALRGALTSPTAGSPKARPLARLR